MKGQNNNQKDTHEETNYEYDPDFIDAIESSLPFSCGGEFNLIYWGDGDETYSIGVDFMTGALDEWQSDFLPDMERKRDIVSTDQAEKINETLKQAIEEMRRANRRKAKAK